MINLEKTVRINMLLDFYGNLLTEKQLDYMQLYFKDDFSLQEIASLHNVSRNAIYDMITRTIKQLESYEEKLELYQKFCLRQEIIKNMRTEFHDNEKVLLYINQLEDVD